MACSSSDEAATLSEWFSDRGLPTSYGKKDTVISVSVSFVSGANDSAYAVGSHAVLGNVNGVEHALYFGFGGLAARNMVLRPDTVFYNSFYEGITPKEPLGATVYWQKEDPTMHDTSWVQFNRPWLDSADISIDDFSFSLPEAVPDDTLLIGIKLKAGSNIVLRIETKSITDIPGFARVAQKTKIIDECSQCLHAGARESLLVSIDYIGEVNINRPVVFAELQLFPKRMDTTGSELGHPLPVYVYGADGSLETYRVRDGADSSVYKYGHPNLVFWAGESDTLKLQVTNSMRKGMAESFTFKLGTPMLKPKSLQFYNSIYSTEKVFSDRQAYAKYDFGTIEETAQLRLWFADID